MKNATTGCRGIFPPVALALLLPGFPAYGAPPDATKDCIDTTYTYNLGPTGARGWIYNPGNDWAFVPEGLTYESRQIKVTQWTPARRSLASCKPTT